MNAILSCHAQSELRNIQPCVVISNKKDAPGLKIAREKFHIPTEIAAGVARELQVQFKDGSIEASVRLDKEKP